MHFDRLSHVTHFNGEVDTHRIGHLQLDIAAGGGLEALLLYPNLIDAGRKEGDSVTSRFVRIGLARLPGARIGDRNLGTNFLSVRSSFGERQARFGLRVQF